MTAWLILGWTAVYLALRVPLPVALLLAVNSSMYHFVEAPKKPKKLDKERTKKMAAVEKLYGTHEQYKEFRGWCYDNKPEALEFFYSWDTDDKFEHVVCLFPSEMDEWMLEHCPLEWVTDQIKLQYS